jgi:hypothetical protein
VESPEAAVPSWSVAVPLRQALQWVVRSLSRTAQTISIKDEEGEQAARCGAFTVAAVEAASAVPAILAS